MTRLLTLVVLAAAASTLTIACWPTPTRRARRLARRPPPGLDLPPYIDPAIVFASERDRP